MTPHEEQQLNHFSTTLLQHLLRIANAGNAASSESGIAADSSPRLLESDDLTSCWLSHANQYLGDAVGEIASYPVVSVSWAAFLGMAVAHEWDTNPEALSQRTYTDYYGADGFNDLDEHCLRDICSLSLTSDEAIRLSALIRRCGEQTVAAIRHEGAEPQTPMAFHLFARACTVMFSIGAHLELQRLGYKMERLQ